MNFFFIVRMKILPPHTVAPEKIANVGRAKSQACADPWARNPIGASEIFFINLIGLYLDVCLKHYIFRLLFIWFKPPYLAGKWKIWRYVIFSYKEQLEKCHLVDPFVCSSKNGLGRLLSIRSMRSSMPELWSYNAPSLLQVCFKYASGMFQVCFTYALNMLQEICKYT